VVAVGLDGASVATSRWHTELITFLLFLIVVLVEITLAAVLNFIIKFALIAFQLSHDPTLLVYGEVKFFLLVFPDLWEVLFEKCYTIEPSLDVIDLVWCSCIADGVCGGVSSDWFAKREASVRIIYHMILSVLGGDVRFDSSYL